MAHFTGLTILITLVVLLAPGYYAKSMKDVAEKFRKIQLSYLTFLELFKDNEYWYLQRFTVLDSFFIAYKESKFRDSSRYPDGVNEEDISAWFLTTYIASDKEKNKNLMFAENLKKHATGKEFWNKLERDTTTMTQLEEIVDFYTDKKKHELTKDIEKICNGNKIIAFNLNKMKVRPANQVKYLSKVLEKLTNIENDNQKSLKNKLNDLIELIICSEIDNIFKNDPSNPEKRQKKFDKLISPLKVDKALYDFAMERFVLQELKQELGRKKQNNESDPILQSVEKLIINNLFDINKNLDTVIQNIKKNIDEIEEFLKGKKNNLKDFETWFQDRNDNFLPKSGVLPLKCVQEEYQIFENQQQTFNNENQNSKVVQDCTEINRQDNQKLDLQKINEQEKLQLLINPNDDSISSISNEQQSPGQQTQEKKNGLFCRRRRKL